MKYLLLGSGAGVAAGAERLRALDALADTLVITPEPAAPYDHAPLASMVALPVLGPVKPFLPPAWYAANNVKLWTARRVAELDTARSCIVTDAAQRIYYDRLLLEIPANPPPPPPVQPAQFSTATTYAHRNYADLDRLIHAVQGAAGSGQSLTVLGPTLMAMEMLTVLASLKLSLTWVTGRTDLPLADLVGPAIAGAIARSLADRNVRIVTAAQPLPHNLTINAQVPVADLTLVRPTPIRAEQYVLTDNTHQTSVPGVYAIGMGAAALSPQFGKHLKLLSAQYVAEQARSAAAAMTGHTSGDDPATPTTPPPPTTSTPELAYTLFDGKALTVCGEPRFAVRWSTAETEGALSSDGFNAADQWVATASLK